MDKKSKGLVGILFLLALVCFGLFFLFKDDSYTVTFDSDGGSTVASQKVKKNELATVPVEPTKDGYTFSEWQLDNVLYDFQTAVTQNITLKATWLELYEVNVTLEDKEYKEVVINGDKIDINNFNFPQKEGYTIKLYTNGNEEYNLTNQVTSSMNLIGRYVELKRVTVKFDSAGGNKVSDITLWEGSTISEPTVTRNGYAFDGWYLENTKFNFSTPIVGNIKLTARWSEANSVNVIFEVDGKVYKTVSVKENSKVSRPDNPKKTGYLFDKWLLNGSEYDFSSTVTKAITLVASFKEARQYRVTFNSNGGSIVKEVNVYEGSTVTRPTNPTRNGYTFVEWRLNDKKYDFNDIITGNITLVAKWAPKVNQFTVTFNTDGGTNISAQTVVANKTVNEPINPTKTGYRFIQWQLNGKKYDFSTPVTKNITLVALWNPIKTYEVTFDSTGGTSIRGQTIAEGSTAIRPATNPTRDGYVFREWQLNGVTYTFDVPVTSNITLKAVWVPGMK